MRAEMTRKRTGEDAKDPPSKSAPRSNRSSKRGADKKPQRKKNGANTEQPANAEQPAASPSPDSKAAFPIVGIGASAGGLEAYRRLLQALPLDTGAAFVLVQHLDPTHASMLEEILS